MHPTLISLLCRLTILGIETLVKHYKSLTPEEWEELTKAAKESFERAGNMGSNVNE